MTFVVSSLYVKSINEMSQLQISNDSAPVYNLITTYDENISYGQTNQV